MEVDGKEFLRNVGIEQDKERLLQEQEKLEELKRTSIKREQTYPDMTPPVVDEDSAFVDLSIGHDSSSNNINSHNNVDDIILETRSSNNKKKYIVLGIGLILLFIITVLVIRLISNSETENQLNEVSPLTSETVKEEILNTIDSNEEYQKVIDRKIALEESSKLDQKQIEEKIMNEIQVPKDEVENVPLVLDTPKLKTEEKRDLFELDQESKKIAEEQKAKEKNEAITKASQLKPKKLSKPKKDILIPPAKEKNFTKNSVLLKGYFVQIGAFTKAPNKNLLKTITQKGYTYKVYTLTIKGKLYNKVLIGSYNTRADATRNLNQIKQDFKNPNAYILKF